MKATPNPKAYTAPYGTLWIVMYFIIVLIAFPLVYYWGDNFNETELQYGAPKVDPTFAILYNFMQWNGTITGYVCSSVQHLAYVMITRTWYFVSVPDYVFDHAEVLLDSEAGVTSITATMSSYWSHYFVCWCILMQNFILINLMCTELCRNYWFELHRTCTIMG